MVQQGSRNVSVIDSTMMTLITGGGGVEGARTGRREVAEGVQRGRTGGALGAYRQRRGGAEKRKAMQGRPSDTLLFNLI